MKSREEFLFVAVVFVAAALLVAAFLSFPVGAL